MIFHIKSTVLGLAQKAITAVARKLLVLIWRIAIEGRPYRPTTAG